MEQIKETLQELKENGFEGFVKVGELKRDYRNREIPHTSGIYLILYLAAGHPQFIYPGTGGFFKGKDPNISIERLNSKWVANEAVIYIGKANDLNSRLRQYMRFGCKENVGHYGGRYIWQIADADKLVVCWKEFEEAREKEKEMISCFKEKHNGMFPFANLVG